MRTLHSLRFLVVLLTLLPSVSRAEDNRFADEIEMVRGSELLSVRSLAQDRQKRIWIGTDKNLYSYDGYNIAIHYDRKGNNDHLLINSIVCEGDSLFLGCSDGIVIYDRVEETFIPVETLKGIEVFTLEKQGDVIWIGSEIGLYKYSLSSKDFSHISVQSQDHPGNIRSIEIMGNRLYTGSRLRGQLGLFSSGSVPDYFIFPASMFPRSFSSIDAISPMEDDDHLLVGTSSSLYKVDVRNLSADLISPLSWVKTLLRHGNVYYVGTDNGLFLYDARTDLLSELLGTVVWTILKDADGNLWFGSDSGLLLFRPDKLIRNTYIAPENANNLYGNIVGDKDGNIFAGSSYGILSFDFQEEARSPSWFKMGDPDYPLNHNKVRKIVLNTETGDIWAATAGGLVQYDRQTSHFLNYTIPSVPLYNTYDLLFDGDTMWAATYNGVMCIRDRTILKSYTSEDGLSSNRVVRIQKDGGGNLWIRTIDRCLFLINPETHRIEQFLPGGGLSKFDLLFSDSAGDIWISSGREVFKVHGRRIVSRLHLLGSQTSAELTDFIEVDNTVWACSPDGIYIIGREGTSFKRIFTDRNYAGMYYDAARNRVLLGTLDRIDYIRVSDAMDQVNRSDVPISVTKITTSNGTVIPPDDYADGHLVLPNNSSVFIKSDVGTVLTIIPGKPPSASSTTWAGMPCPGMRPKGTGT